MDGSHSLLIRSQQFGTQMPQGGHPPHHSITSSAPGGGIGRNMLDISPGSPSAEHGVTRALPLSQITQATDRDSSLLGVGSATIVLINVFGSRAWRFLRSREPSAKKRRVTQSPHDQRRYTTVGEYLIRLAAEQESRDAAPAV